MAAYNLIREHVPTLERDRELHLDIEKVAKLIDSGEIRRRVAAATA